MTVIDFVVAAVADEIAVAAVDDDIAAVDVVVDAVAAVGAARQRLLSASMLSC